jgi:yeast amino acid transporter
MVRKRPDSFHDPICLANTWNRFAFCCLQATEVSAVAGLFNFQFPQEYLQSMNYPRDTLQWDFGMNTSPAVWVAMFLLAALIVNLLPVRVYGEIEYCFGCIKMVVMIALILFNIIISGKNVDNGTTTSRFFTYQSPYGFFSNQTVVATRTETYAFTGNTGRLLGMWSALTTIFFSFEGFATVAVTAAENKDLDKDETIKMSSRKAPLRVILLYSLLVFTVGLNVPYTDPNIKDTSINSIRRGENSPFIVACVRAGVVGWPHFLNAFFIFSAASTAINALYIASRLLHALASIRNVWPQTGWAYRIKCRLEKTNTYGVPVAAVFVSWVIGFLGFLGARPSPARILGRMAIFCTTSIIIIFLGTSAAFLFFYTRTVDGDPGDEVTVKSTTGAVLNRNSSTYPYKSHLQWVRAAYCVVGFFLLVLFNGWRSFLYPFSPPDFIASYISISLFIVITVLYHIKDEREWNPFKWTRRVTMDIQNPTVTRERNMELRKGRLHRVNKQTLFCRENAVRFLEFLWVWLK